MTKEFVAEYGIDIVVHGDDMNEQWLRFFYDGPMELGILRVLPYTPGISTSQLIQMVFARSSEFKK